MLIVVNEVSVLNVKEVIGMTLSKKIKEIKTKVSDGFLGLFPTYDKTEEYSYLLTFQYISQHGIGNEMTFTYEHSDYNRVKNSAKQIIVQLRRHDNTMIDEAFEEAILKGQ